MRSERYDSVLKFVQAQNGARKWKHITLGEATIGDHKNCHDLVKRRYGEALRRETLVFRSLKTHGTRSVGRKTYQARTEELDTDLKSPPGMAAWSTEVLLDRMAEVSECRGSHVQEAWLSRWTSVGYVKVLGHSGRHGAFTIMHECTCSSLSPKDDFVRYLARNSSLQRLE